MDSNADLAARSSYQQYKLDTSAFLTWLLNTAQACGYQYVRAAQPRQSNLPTAPEITVAGNGVPVREIIKQAQLVCSVTADGRSMTRGLHKIARRAIAARQKFSSHIFQNAPPTEDSLESDSKHEFFTKTLEAAVDMLDKHSRDIKSSTVEHPLVASDETVKLSNLFACLEIEDCEDSEQILARFSEDPQHALVATTTAKRGKKGRKEPKKIRPSQPPIDKVETEDVWMRVNCFFDDLHRLKEAIVKVWEGLKKQEVDLMAASLTTNAAVALATQMERDLLEQMSVGGQGTRQTTKSLSLCGNVSTYSCITGAALQARTPSLEHLSAHDVSMALTDLGRHWFYDVAVIMAKFSHALLSLDPESENQVPKSGLPIQEWFRIPSLLTAFLTFSAQPDACLETEGYGRLKDMDSSLTSLMLDIVNRNSNLMGRPSDNPRTEYIDAISHHAFKLLSAELSSAGVFAWAVLWELQGTLASKSDDIHASLLSQAEKSWTLFDYTHTEKAYENGPRWKYEDTTYLQLLWRCHDIVLDRDSSWKDAHDRVVTGQQGLNSQLRQDDFDHWRKYLHLLPLSNAQKKQRMTRIKDVKDLYFSPEADVRRYFHANPVACGSMLYNIALAQEQAGICLVNFNLTALWVAYIYICLKNHNQIKGEWKDMNHFIDVHLSSIFFGSIPDHPKRLLSVFLLRVGQSASKKSKPFDIAFTGGDRTGRLPLSKARSSCLSITDTAIAMDAWLKGSENSIRSVHAIKRLMESSDKPTPARPNNSAPFDPAGFLQRFCAHITSDCARFATDYITLTRTCHDLMYEIVHHEHFARLSRQLEPAGSAGALSRHLGKSFKHYDQSFYWRCAYIILVAEDSAENIYRSRMVKNVRLAGFTGYSFVYPLGKWCDDYLFGKGLLQRTEDESKAVQDESADEKPQGRIIELDNRGPQKLCMRTIPADQITDDQLRELYKGMRDDFGNSWAE